MRRLALLFAAISLIVAACGDDDNSTATSGTSPSSTSSTVAAATTSTTAAPTTSSGASEGFSVTSGDGRVTIQVPPGALAQDPGISITYLPPDEIPEDLAEVDPKAWAYSLEPGDLTFDAPARLTMEIPFDEISDGVAGAVPILSMITTTPDGEGWQLLDDIRIERVDDTVLVSGDTDHFSRMAVLSEQVLVETRFVEITHDPSMEFRIDFLWSNGAPLTPPALGSSSFVPDVPATDVDPVQVSFQDGLVSLACPPRVTSLFGTFEIELLLQAVSDSSGNTGLVSAPRLVTLDEAAPVTVATGLELLCRPTISEDGTLTMDIVVDHPGGAEIVAGEDFRGGLSALYLDLSGAFPQVRVGLIRDVNSNGIIDPEDVMYPTFAGEVAGDRTTFVLPLFGFGDYFPYLIDGLENQLETEVLVRDGATVLLGGLTEKNLSRANTAVPLLSGIPYVARVFSDESRQIENVELLVFLTPNIVQNSE